MTEWITQFIERFGYLGIVFLMVAENVFPPIPSELIMPFAGYTAARGSLHPAGVVLAGLVGTLLGTMPWYWAGRKLGLQRLKAWSARWGRWMTIHPDELDQAQAHFRRYGPMAVMLGRLVPAIRTIISVPAGIARMGMAPFLLWSTVGSAVWIGGLTGVGYFFESQWTQAQSTVDVVSRLVVIGLVVLYIWRVITFNRTPSRSA